MTTLKESFIVAIQNGDCKLLKTIIKKYTINNNNNKNHTLNIAIITILNTCNEYYNPDIIKILIDHGAKINNNTDHYNTLTITLNYGSKYVGRGSDRERMKAETNLLDLIQMLINYGARSNPSKGSLNTFTLAISLRNIRIINLITETKPVPDNSGYLSNYIVSMHRNTLTEAVLTGYLEIVKIACRFGAKPNTNFYSNKIYIPYTMPAVNTLDCAICGGNILIVKEIVKVGGFTREITSCTIESFWFHLPQNWEYDPIIDIYSLLDMIVISGSKMTPEAIKYLNKLTKGTKYNDLLTKALDCNAIIDKSHSLNDKEQERIKSLIVYLKNVMNELVEQAANKRNKICEINKTIPIPLCCIDIIFEYHRDDGMRCIEW